jgi:hypothetical protein
MTGTAGLPVVVVVIVLVPLFVISIIMYLWRD